MPSPNEITPRQLLAQIGLPDAPAIIDVCLDEDHACDPFVIPTARRLDHRHIDAIEGQLAGRASVIVCQKGRKLSQGVAAILRERGLKSEVLQGGMVGWREQPAQPAIASAKLPTSRLWVTRLRPKIDRIATPWLIRRFIDPDAQFLFVARSEVMGVAERFGATPFDIEGAALSHEGELCTFDAVLSHFELDIPALTEMARVIRAADTDRHDIAPQAAGFLAISVGLSRQYRDDNDQLDAGLAIYDALFRWARDARDEGHSWP